METSRLVSFALALLITSTKRLTTFTITTAEVITTSFYTLQGYRMDDTGIVFQTIPVATTAISCALRCVQNIDCKVVHFNTQDSQCAISHQNPYEINAPFITTGPEFQLMARTPADLSGDFGTLVFRGTPYLELSMYDSWLGSDSNSHSPVLPIGCVRGDSMMTCDRHYRDFNMASAISSSQEVTLAVYQNGTLSSWLRFDHQGSANQNTWMSTTHLVASDPWADLLVLPSVHFFSVEGLPAQDRRFYISDETNGCLFDDGWLVVSDSPSDYCSYMRSFELPFPRILFSPLAGKARWTQDAALADALMVFVN